MKYSALIALAAAAVLALPMAGAFELQNPVVAEESQRIVGAFQMPDIQVGDSYNGAEVIATNSQLVFITVSTTEFGLFSLKTQLDENVRYVESDINTHTLQYSPNDYYVAHSSNWGMNKIGLGVAWDKTRGSTSIKDGHIDSGMVIGHEDLSGSRFLAGWDYKDGDATPQDTSGCSWHSSHTMGTVTATINNAKGFPGTAQITEIPIKIFGASTTPSRPRAARASSSSPRPATAAARTASATHGSRKTPTSSS